MKPGGKIKRGCITLEMSLAHFGWSKDHHFGCRYCGENARYAVYNHTTAGTDPSDYLCYCESCLPEDWEIIALLSQLP